jgi:hypothetical protein
MKIGFLGLFILILITGCDTTKMSKTPDSQFIGEWKLTERSMFEGIQIEIKKEDGNFFGYITKLNNHKLVKMFMAVGDKILTKNQRNSNFEFVITEKKIASSLFSAYGISTSTSYTVKFDGKSTILLGDKGSSGKYVKVK